MKPKNMLLTLDTCLEQEKTGRKTGLLVTALMNGLMLVLSLPFMDWIQLVNIPKLFAKLGITREAAGSLYSSYSIFSLLGFVKNSGKGVFGLYAMLLLILLACNLVSGASVYLEGLSQQQRERWEGRTSYLCGRKGLDTSDSTSGVWLLRFCPVFQQCGENEGLFRIVDPGS
ncbi:MAG: hypothetical protein ACLU3U_13490 [Gallintestinimicrobium sp.]